MARKSDNRAGRDAAQEEGTAMQPGVAGQVPQNAPSRDAGRVLRVLALVAVAIGLAALTAAACVLSYSSIHHLATSAGVSPRLARLYPLIFDALLVVAGCCVLALRGAGLVSRVYAWLCLLVLLGGLAAGGAVHAAAIKVPRRLGGILAAVIPWALVLIGFGLLLALLRYARIRRLSQQPAGPEPDPDAGHAALSDVVVIENAVAPPERAIAPAAAAPGDQPSPPDLAKAAPPRPVVRQADLQLRARVPRQQAGEQVPAGPAAPHTPFMPPVGPLPAAGAAEPAGAAGAVEAAGAAGAASTVQTNPRLSRERPASAGSTARHEPAASSQPAAGQSGASQPAASPPGPEVTAEVEPGSGTTAETVLGTPDSGRPTEPGPAPGMAAGSDAVTSTNLNPAPILSEDDEDGEPGGPPTLRRPRSSPTPPED